MAKRGAYFDTLGCSTPSDSSTCGDTGRTNGPPPGTAPTPCCHPQWRQGNTRKMRSRPDGPRRLLASRSPDVAREIGSSSEISYLCHWPVASSRDNVAIRSLSDQSGHSAETQL